MPAENFGFVVLPSDAIEEGPEIKISFFPVQYPAIVVNLAVIGQYIGWYFRIE